MDFFVLKIVIPHAIILNYRRGKDMIAVIIISTKTICNDVQKNYRCWLLVFKWTLLVIKLMPPALFRYTEYGDVRMFYNNSINCFIFVILRNIRDISIKLFLSNF